METIGDRIRRIRAAKGIARKDLAAAAGMSYSGLADLESGKAKSSTKLHRLATALGVDVLYLETGKPQFSGVADTPYGIGKVGIDPELVLDVARALLETHAELGLTTYDFTANPQLFIDAYQHAQTFGNFTRGRGRAWLGAHIKGAVMARDGTDGGTTGNDDQGVSKTAARRTSKKS